MVRHHTEETKKKISALRKGKKYSLETKQKMSESHKGKTNKGRLGKPHSLETKLRMSESLKGEKHPNYGKSLSKETRKKIGEASKGNTYNKGKSVSNERKRQMRIHAINRIQQHIKDNGQVIPNYNSSGCKVIDEYAKEHGYNFQHALNGGEFYIKELGYWLDGYDKEQNVAIEIDEKHHFDMDGNLLKKDIERQNEIQLFLDCKFIRIRIG